MQTLVHRSIIVVIEILISERGKLKFQVDI